MHDSEDREEVNHRNSGEPRDNEQGSGALPGASVNSHAELQAIAGVLAKLQPAAPMIDRDRLFFLAGQASAASRSPMPANNGTFWAWPASSVVSAAVAAVLLCVVIWDRVPRPMPQRYREVPTVAIVPSEGSQFALTPLALNQFGDDISAFNALFPPDASSSDLPSIPNVPSWSTRSVSEAADEAVKRHNVDLERRSAIPGYSGVHS